MKKLKDILKFTKNGLDEVYLFASRKCLAGIYSKPKMKILFSKKDDWEPIIRREFRYTRHELTFDTFGSENITKYDLIVPLTNSAIKYLNKVRNLIVNNPIPIPTTECMCLCEDKYLFNQTLIRDNFGEFIPKVGNRLSYPYVLKKRIDEFGMNSHIILDRQKEQDLMNTLPIQQYFCQELVLGEYEYATHIFFSKGRIVHSVNIRYSFETDIFILGKNKIKSRKKISQCPYLSIFSSILNSIGFEGLCCFDYKVIDNRPLIFEINPRFGGSLCDHFFSFMKYFN